MKKYPPEFKHFTNCMHQDIHLTVKNLDKIQEDMVSCLNPNQRVILRIYLKELLSSSIDDAGLSALWDHTGPDWGFPKKKHVRVFLTRALELLK